MEDVKLIEDLIKNPWKRTAPNTEKPSVSEESTSDTSPLARGTESHSGASDEDSQPENDKSAA